MTLDSFKSTVNPTNNATMGSNFFKKIGNETRPQIFIKSTTSKGIFLVYKKSSTVLAFY